MVDGKVSGEWERAEREGGRTDGTGAEDEEGRGGRNKAWTRGEAPCPPEQRASGQGQSQVPW